MEKELFAIKSPANDTLWVIDVQNYSFDERLIAVSLQGIVNRDQATIYLVYSPRDIQWLGYIQNVTAHSFKFCSLPEAINMFSHRVHGIVIYDDDDMSINHATTYAGLNDALMIKKGEETYGLEVLLDATKADIKTNSDVYIEYFKYCNPETLANFAPHDIKSRDFIIQNKMLCIYFEPGPFAWPQVNNEFINIISAFSSGSDGFNRWLFGWFQTPTITEEDYGIQVLSHHGVIFLPCTNVPNLSILQAINSTIPIDNNPVQDIKIRDKIYITFGMADGDSLDVMYKYMNSYWFDPYRGELPIAWSIDTALMKIAPVILQYYYATANINDSFIAGGSGTGIIFPDFFEPGLLSNYVENSATFGIDKVWLLNSYTPYETRYSNQVLDVYAEHYNGIVLDYGSLPIKKPYWKQSNKPFVRSLHYMGDHEDFEAKLALITSFSEKPLFVYVTLYPWVELDLDAVLDAIDHICGDYEFVTLDEFFNLVNKSMGDSTQIFDTRRSLASTRQYYSQLQGIMVNEGWIILVTALTIGLWLIVTPKNKDCQRPTKAQPKAIYIIYYGAANSLYLTMIIWVIFQNYWQWLALAIIPIVAMIYPFVRKKSNVEKPDDLFLFGFVLGLSAIFTIMFPIALLVGAWAYFRIVRSNPEFIVISYPVAIAISILLSFVFWTTWLVLPVILFLLLSAIRLKEPTFPGHNSKTSDEKSDSKNTLVSNYRIWDTIIKGAKEFLFTFLPAVYLSIAILPMFYLDMAILNLKLGYNWILTLTLAIFIPILAYPLAFKLMRFNPYVKMTFPLWWILIILSPLPFLTAIFLVLIQAQLYSISIDLFNNYIKKPNKLHRIKDFAKNLAALPIIVGLAVIFPPMIFSVYFAKLSSFILTFLYFTPLIFGLISLFLTIGIIFIEYDKMFNQISA
ncbi:GxGYxYP domain-containing protein [[Eubacterium] cellulosolvens]